MMRLVYILLALLLIAIAIMQNLFWLAALFVIGFTAFFGAFFLVPLAIVIDGYFNAFAAVPWLSITAVVWYVCSELVRLRMRIMK